MKINFTYNEQYVIHNILDALVGIRRGRPGNFIKLDAKFENLRKTCADFLPAYKKMHENKNEYYFIVDNEGEKFTRLAAEYLKEELPFIIRFIKSNISKLNSMSINLGEEIISDLESFFGLSYNFPIDITVVYSPTLEGGGTVAYARESNKAIIILELNPKIEDSACSFDTFIHESVHLLNKTTWKAIEKAYWRAGCKEYIKLEEIVASVLAPCGLLSEKYDLSPFLPESYVQENLAPIVKDRLEDKISFEEFCKRATLITNL